MLIKFQGNQWLIATSSINCLNLSFCSLKLCIKDEFKDQMVNYIQWIQKLACMLKIYRTCNPTVEFLKYEYNNKLLVGVKFFRVTLSVTWTQSDIS